MEVGCSAPLQAVIIPSVKDCQHRLETTRFPLRSRLYVCSNYESRMIQLAHPTSGQQVTIKYANWNVFFFGWIWFFVHRDWLDGVFYYLSAALTFGLANFVWPFIAEKRLAEHYQQNGYQITAQEPMKGLESPFVPLVLPILAFASVILVLILIPSLPRS